MLVTGVTPDHKGIKSTRSTMFDHILLESKETRQTRVVGMHIKVRILTLSLIFAPENRKI
ncbi:MAG: hypothetical protein AYK19_12480 [Theionarchaea archaeon DG-70-1]|nr:MAG: hypothetical protein AYK19_12480 [Theionarchaea archaeon DG-70-1]